MYFKQWVDRAYKMCSNYKAFSLELDFLKRYLSRNNFPLAFIESSFRIKLNSIFCLSRTILTVQKKPPYVKIPFISWDQNIYIKKQLTAIASEIYPHLQLKLIFSNGYTIGSFFRYCEHMGVSPRTFQPVSIPLKSSIRDHSDIRNHSISKSDFKVLHTCKSQDLSW